VPRDLPSDGLHDDYAVTLNMMADSLESVRWEARVATDKATINGMSIADKEESLKLAADVVEFRANTTAEAITAAIAAAK
ncbi:MAG: hypothetical protein RLN70_08240, partial [Rhodospirillaceae bacterium]